ncbi:hypothetical protein V6N11_067108 [Hibiscus sabdariffa]|uniref:Uncharacterized protein n=1 Tax=Hibiscus sabdariffa TaxID=183260 RepID=A0ABR2SPX3_9ROSI
MRMASRVDALQAIERLDGLVLYGSRVRVSFAARDTRDSFWRRKMGSLPRLPDPPQGDVVIDAGTLRTEEARVERSRRSVVGIMDDEKLSVLETCAIGWMKEATPIRVLVQKMAVEAELVQVPTVEFREGETGSKLGDKSHEASVALPVAPFIERAGPSVGEHAQSLDAVVGYAGASVGSDRPAGGRGGVCSAGDAMIAVMGDRSRVFMDEVQNSELIGDRDSPVGLLECGEGNLDATGLLVSNACALSSPVAVLGDAEAALAPVLGSVPGGVRKVKSVNYLVRLWARWSRDKVLLLHGLVRGVSVR